MSKRRFQEEYERQKFHAARFNEPLPKSIYNINLCMRRYEKCVRRQTSFKVMKLIVVGYAISRCSQP